MNEGMNVNEEGKKGAYLPRNENSDAASAGASSTFSPLSLIGISLGGRIEAAASRRKRSLR